MLGFGLPVGWILILIFLAVVAVVVALVMSSRRGAAGPRAAVGFPVRPAGPGRFRVRGVDRSTKQDRVWECDADSPENAQVKAELEGIVVTLVERV